MGKTLYSVPWRLIGQQLDAKESLHTVEFFSNGALVKTHARQEKGKVTDYQDYPPEKVAFFQRGPTWCRNRASEIGPATFSLVETLMEINALYRLRSAQGVVRLCDKYGSARLERACARATQVGDPTYRTVKGILLAGTEDEGEDAAPTREAPAHLHGPSTLLGHLGNEVAS